MWNNIATKRNPKAPDYACRDKSCKGVIWPMPAAKSEPAPTSNGKIAVAYPPIDDNEYPFDLDVGR